jgi:hypothetical protein
MSTNLAFRGKVLNATVAPDWTYPWITVKNNSVNECRWNRRGVLTKDIEQHDLHGPWSKGFHS